MFEKVSDGAEQPYSAMMLVHRWKMVNNCIGLGQFIYVCVKSC